MAKGGRSRRRITSQETRHSPYGLATCNRNVLEDMCAQKSSGPLNKKDWEDAICSVCMEFPHNAVLLLCSSYDKGCRPYMCGTSCRYSNCLDQYKKAYAKVISCDPTPASNLMAVSESGLPSEKCEVIELACPLCRGQVKGWTVVEPAREFLNAKKRTCMQDNCTFLGTYKELRKHVRAEHPSSRPREVDPMMEQRWRRLERERERDDVISTIRSSMPGAMVFGDYVIEGSHFGIDADGAAFVGDQPERNGHSEAGFNGNLFNVLMLLHAHAFGQSGNGDLRRRLRQQQQERSFRHIQEEEVLGNHIIFATGSEESDPDGNDSNDDNNANDGGMSLVSRLRRHGRVLLGGSGRRRRRREATEGEEGS
ncbi:hypothetical protein MLD38_023191 [Melastoma candidum]|uniref:Uncharacterized protein n=1 Tax=Melastoma candidum TaxID=119954 RepID=A0ACB9QLW4_9MYRT|nr:hypothetical protein MLD38_023191 [Melastoma candidum]